MGPIIDVFGGILGHLGHFAYFLLIFSKMDLKTQKFDPHKIIYFWKAEVVPFSDIPKIFKSEVIWGHERSSKVNFENEQNLDMLYLFGNL